MFVIGSSGDDVNEYNLSTPFDTSTLDWVGATTISNKERGPQGIAFSSDGAKMFVTGSISDKVHEYDLSSVYPIAVTGTYARPSLAFVSSGLDFTTGNLAITFSEEINATSVVPAKIHVRASGTSAGGVTLTATELVTAADSTVISFTLNAEHLEAVAAMTEPKLTIDSGAVQDTHGRLIVGTSEAYPIAVTGTYRPPPAFVSSGLDFTTGKLAITFSEEIDAISVVPAKIHVRASGTSAGGVTLTATELVTAADSTVISFTLNAEHLEAVAAMTEPKLTIDSGAVQDTYGGLFVGTSEAYPIAVTGTYVRPPPAFVSSGLDFTTGKLAITFSEEIDATSVVPAKIHVRVSGTSAGGVTLTATELVTAADSTVISFILNDEHLEAVAAMIEPKLTIDSGAVQDTHGSLFVGTSEAYPIAVTGTYVSPPPTFVSSRLGMATGNLAITFSDKIDAADIVPAKIHVRELGNYTHGVTLTAGEIGTTADGTVISFTLKLRAPRGNRGNG